MLAHKKVQYFFFVSRHLRSLNPRLATAVTLMATKYSKALVLKTPVVLLLTALNHCQSLYTLVSNTITQPPNILTVGD